MADRRSSADPEEVFPSRQAREFEATDQAPGNPGWTRAFADTAAAQREPLADGVEQLPGIDPAYWHGPARERFAAARDLLAGEWKTVHDAHDAVVRRVENYSTFVHELQHLWEADRGNPAALRHTADLHDRTTAALAAELLARAAQLDTVAVRSLPAVEPEPATAEPVPQPPSLPRAERDGRSDDPRPDDREQGEPDSESDDSDADDPGVSGQDDPADQPGVDGLDDVATGGDLSAGGHPGDGTQQHVQPVVDAPDAHDVPTTPAQRFHYTEKLGIQLLAGARLLRVPWEPPRR